MSGLLFNRLDYAMVLQEEGKNTDGHIKPSPMDTEWTFAKFLL